MSDLGHTYRFVVWNSTGVSLGVATVRYRTEKIDANGALAFGSTATAATAGSQASGTGQATSTVDNSTARMTGLDGIVELPALTGTATGHVEIWLQTSPDGGANWPDAPDLRRGKRLATTYYAQQSNPPARDVPISI